MNKCLSAFLVLAATTAGAADEYYSADELFQIGSQWVQAGIPQEILDQYEIPSAGDWQVFWGQISKALESESLVDLQELQPHIHAALDILRGLPDGRPYADWLEQRMDYFDMAEAARVALPSPVPPAPPPVPPSVKKRVVLVPRAVPPPPKPVADARLKIVRSRERWDRKLAKREKPAGADELVPRLKKVFRREGVPEELVWMAEVESSMNPSARSPVGALGLFQLMPATARSLGLRTSPPDERKNPEKNAQAAARYLKALYGRFLSWPLAFAAYNAGEGRVARLLKGSASGTFEAIESALPVETQMYVPKVLATISLREGKDAAALPPP